MRGLTRVARTTAIVVSALAAALAVGLGTAGAHDPVIGVEPATVSGALAPGTGMTVDKVVHTTAIPPLVDIFLVEDESGSFADDIANLQALAGPGGPLITALDATGTNYATGVAGFRDFDQSSWGSPGDWVYRRLADITPGGGGFSSGVPLLSAGGGGDFPEAQLEALHYAADPGHAAIDSNGDAGTTGAQDTSAGLQPSWRPAAKRVILLATDAPCHVTGDAGGWPGDAGTTSAATTAAALAAQGITVIGLTPAGAGTIGCVDDLAAGTGGSVHATTASGADIVDAILAGLGNLPVTVTPSAVCDAGLTASFAPASQTVTSGEDAAFTETLTADAGAPEGTTLSCTVTFLVDGEPAGDRFVQRIDIDILDVTPPAAACVETNNPSGGNVPKAGPSAGKSGQNPDGFYQLNAEDDVDPAVQVFAVDLATGTVFGPFAPGVKVKYTQANGATPSMEPGARDIDWKLKGQGDMATYAVDASGNTSDRTSCLVPAPPK